MLASSEALMQRVDELENDYDEKFKIIFRALRQLLRPAPASQAIGFRPKASKK
jgi:hypothetical protein